MSIFSEQLGYNISDLGFDKSLVKPVSSAVALEETTPELSNVFTSGVSPKSVISGELISSLEQQTGVVFSGKTAFDNTQAGYRLGIDTSDSLIKFYIGDSSNYLNWTGSVLNISGVLTAGSIDIGGSDATSFHVDSAGNMWLGGTTLTASPYKVLNTGDLRLANSSNSTDYIRFYYDTALGLIFIEPSIDNSIGDLHIGNVESDTKRFPNINITSANSTVIDCNTATTGNSRIQAGLPGGAIRAQITVTKDDIEMLTRTASVLPTGIKFVLNTGASNGMSLRFPNLGSVPSTCTVGDVCVSGGKLQICTTADTWTVVGTQA